MTACARCARAMQPNRTKSRVLRPVRQETQKPQVVGLRLVKVVVFVGEVRIVDLVVAGSNPVIHPTYDDC